MLLGEALAIPGAHLLQGQVLVSDPDEPTLTRVAFGIASRLPLHANDPELDKRGLPEMQSFPTRDDHALALLIGALPLRIGRALGLGARSLKQRAVFAGRPAFARARGSATIQFAVALEPDERPTAQLATRLHKASHPIPAISQHDDRTLEEREHGTQLVDAHLDGRLLAANAPLLQDADPATGLLWQEHHRRKLPAHAYRGGRRGQIGHIDHPPIGTAGRFQTLHAVTHQTYPDRLICRFALKPGLHEDLAQVLDVDAPILQRFIDAGPATLEEGRQRQFGQTACLRLAHQGKLRACGSLTRASHKLKSASPLRSKQSYTR
jgi:hypothetical protein